ncbi:MAG: HNH endonuclease signature motif containing protein [Oligoflexia bacterium]|nr:HNH endonuclease signature motif containing protein [Oligoflexia bacterium]
MFQESEIRNLKKMTNHDLLLEAKSSVKGETKKTLWVLHVLREIDRRRAYCEGAYPSLFEFCVSELNYSRGAAYRRINAMRLLRDLPELEAKFEEGVFELTTLANAQSYFQAVANINTQHSNTLEQSATYKIQRFDLNMKREVLKTLESKSTQEGQEYLASISPQVLSKKSKKKGQVDIENHLPLEVREKLKKFKGLIAYKNNNLKNIDVLEEALDLAIKQMEKQGKQKQRNPQQLRQNPSSPLADSTQNIKPTTTSKVSRTLRRVIWQRDQNQCTFIDPLTKNRCPSQHRLEIDHITPKALGGDNAFENLRLLCRSHNTFHAIQVFGQNRMDHFLGHS